jgi:diaminohydroxyphosphoribosylaminopyrimidine deaminase/5-amino-6-(5-phosphoribosylamino)uracil reductase
MRRAIALAERALGETNPNPPVGCLIVRGGVVVGEGFHSRAGSPHAEPEALAAAGVRSRGATAYVTLEPCMPNKAKRTPPCAPRLIEAGVRRVVIGARDANPAVRGAGIKTLRAAGIEVLEGVCAMEAGRLTRHFNHAMAVGRPFITLKAGMTLDGRVATAAGESKWITSARQRAVARRMRRLFDGVLVGIETALHDDPLLLPVPRTRRPFSRVILDSRLRLPLTSRLVASASSNPLILVCVGPAPAKRRALEARGVVVLASAGREGRVRLVSALRVLFENGIRSLMVEGGPEVLGSFVRESVFDELVLFRAPLLLGGRGSRSVVGGENPRSLDEAVAMRRATLSDSATLRYGLAGSDEVDVETYVPKMPRKVRA